MTASRPSIPSISTSSFPTRAFESNFPLEILPWSSRILTPSDWFLDEQWLPHRNPCSDFSVTPDLHRFPHAAHSRLVSSTAAHPAFAGVSPTRPEALGPSFLCSTHYNPCYTLGLGLGSQFFLGPQFFGPGLDNRPQENKIGNQPSLALLPVLGFFFNPFVFFQLDLQSNSCE